MLEHFHSLYHLSQWFGVTSWVLILNLCFWNNVKIINCIRIWSTHFLKIWDGKRVLQLEKISSLIKIWVIFWEIRKLDTIVYITGTALSHWQSICCFHVISELITASTSYKRSSRSLRSSIGIWFIAILVNLCTNQIIPWYKLNYLLQFHRSSIFKN